MLFNIYIYQFRRAKMLIDLRCYLADINMFKCGFLKMKHNVENRWHSVQVCSTNPCINICYFYYLFEFMACWNLVCTYLSTCKYWQKIWHSNTFVFLSVSLSPVTFPSQTPPVSCTCLLGSQISPPPSASPWPTAGLITAHSPPSICAKTGSTSR